MFKVQCENTVVVLWKEGVNSHSLFLVLCFLQRYIIARQDLVALCRRINKWNNGHESFSMLNSLTSIQVPCGSTFGDSSEFLNFQSLLLLLSVMLWSHDEFEKAPVG